MEFKESSLQGLSQIEYSATSEVTFGSLPFFSCLNTLRSTSTSQGYRLYHRYDRTNRAPYHENYWKQFPLVDLETKGSRGITSIVRCNLSACLKNAFREVTFGFCKGTVPGVTPLPLPRPSKNPQQHFKRNVLGTTSRGILVQSMWNDSQVVHRCFPLHKAPRMPKNTS